MVRSLDWTSYILVACHSSYLRYLIKCAKKRDSALTHGGISQNRVSADMFLEDKLVSGKLFVERFDIEEPTNPFEF